MVEVAGLAAIDEGIAFRGGHVGRDLIGQARVGQGPDRIFPTVGVEVADHQHVGVAALGLELVDKLQQLAGLSDA